MGAGHEAKRPVVGVEDIEVGGKLHASDPDAVVIVPAGLFEVQDAFWDAWQDLGVEELLGNTHQDRVVTHERGALRREPGRP